MSGGACGGGSEDLYPDLMEEGSPQESSQEGFPLIHSQSALGPITACEFGGVTGVRPKVRDTEGLRLSKRQLSAPTNNETLQKMNDVCHYLQVICVIGFLTPYCYLNVKCYSFKFAFPYSLSLFFY